MGQMIEGRWDCSSCGKKLIKGRYKHCPSCGKGRGADVKFYIADPNDIVAADVPEKGPDWMCEYCGAYAPDSAECCPNCGAPREGAKTYHEVQQEAAQKEQQEAAQAPTRAVQKKSPVKLLVILALVAAALLWAFLPRHSDAQVSGKSWQRAVDVESYDWVDESGWSLPSGATLKSSSREIRTYDQVLDHYETRSREVPEEYISGYSTEYEDMGNGYFQSYQVPVYSTRYRTEYYQEPVYRSVPVYDTRYVYSIQRWTYNRTLEAGAADGSPYWPEVKLRGEEERESARREAYTLQFRHEDRSYTLKVPLAQWQDYQVGDRVQLTLSAGGSVTKVEHKR